MARIKRYRTFIWAIAAIVMVGGIGAVVAASRVSLPSKADEIPLAEIKRGDIDLKVHATGELRASHTIMLSAPAIGGDSLQLTHLTRTGKLVKKGDVVFEFDPSEQHYKLEQNNSELQQAEFASEADGYSATRHQREVGTGYFDEVAMTISGGQSSTTALADSTEAAQFKKEAAAIAAE